MKKAGIFFLLITSLFGCSKDKFIGSGNATSEFRNVANFNKVSSEGSFSLTIIKGDEQLVEIIADDNIMHRVKTDVINGKLILNLEDGTYRNVHIEAHIKVKDLNEIENSGSGDIQLNNITDAGIFKINNSGSANIYLEGSCDALEIQNEGSGNILAYNMPTENCKIKVQGSGEVEVSCASNLTIKIEGSGNVYYKGTPSINSSISGSGKVINAN